MALGSTRPASSVPRTSLLVIGGFSSSLILALPLTQADAVIVTTHVVVTGVFALIFGFVSRLIYSLRAQDFNQLNTIATQARSLEQANVELRKATLLKTELVGIAAHDVRDPLNAIRGLAQELDHELPPNASARELVNGIGESARRISHLVENLLTDAENETRGLDLRFDPTDLAVLIEDVVADYHWLAGTKDLTLLCQVPPAGQIIARVDPRRFRQLLENLVSNAIKYSPSHKTITLTLECPASRGPRIEVQDERVGLVPSDQDRLFGKFERLSSRPTNGESTSGLGLAIVKAIAEAHGGRVRATSPGRNLGTTVIVELP
ncbi:MAG: HAMP domain-containing histidine kinase [Candidatus Synoicihabitans palmerolidicus]|nr:HAMP domain-containing histidine kinase [Candidatus Synoicihabitans palmerolidicus]MCC5022122.1 HAMP domain-containing histidine kinase [Candidatus Synoicihabitans palmerolidicus]